MEAIQRKERSLKQHLFGGFVWGIFMFLIVEVVFKYMENEAITTNSILKGLLGWVFIAGSMFGMVNFYISKYLKGRKEKKGVSPNN